MNPRWLPLALLLVPLAVSAPAAATLPACDAVTTNAETPYGPYLVPVRSQVYQLWLETNLVPGLQRQACVNADGVAVEPDRYAGEYGVNGGGQPVCAPRLGCIWI